MQHAIQIFGSALTQVFTNLGTALRLTGLVWVGASVLIYTLGYVMVGQPISPMFLRPDAEGQMPALLASFAMVGLVINVLATAYVMMVWSRYCLGADTPSGPMPSVKGQPYGGVLITLILVVAGVGAVAFVLSLLGSLAQPSMPLIIALMVFPLLLVLVLIWLFLRVGAAIPASAQGEILSLTQAWNGSRGKGIWLVAVLAFMTLTILSAPSLLLAGLIIPGNIVSLLGSWLTVLIGTGWLVAIYKHLPEAGQ